MNKIANNYQSAIQIVKDIAIDYAIEDGASEEIDEMVSFYESQGNTIHNQHIIACLKLLSDVADLTHDYTMQCEVEDEEPQKLVIEAEEISADSMSVLSKYELTLESFSKGELVVSGTRGKCRAYYDEVHSNVMNGNMSFDEYIKSQEFAESLEMGHGSTNE